MFSYLNVRVCDPLGKWIQHNTGAWALLCILLALFSGDIRRLLGIPPQRIGLWTLKIRIANVQARIRTIEHAHNNPQGTIFKIVTLIVESLLLIILFLTAVLVLQMEHVVNVAQSLPQSVAPGDIGFVKGVGMLFAAYLVRWLWLLQQVGNYDEERPKLEKKVLKLQEKLRANTSHEKSNVVEQA